MSFRAGFVGLIGMPNAGKSTLINALVGEKISIVTSKPQTTRKRLMGITGDDTFQAVFVDAPGVVRSTKGLNEFIQTEYQSVIQDSDVLLAILNLDEKRPQPLIEIINMVRASGKPWAVVVTKSDLGSEDRVGLLRVELVSDTVPMLVTSVVEDRKGSAKSVLDLVKTMLPEAPGPLFEQDILTPSNLRDLAGEVVREKCFEALADEIPYGLGVKVRAFEERDGRATAITADIVVDKASHKPMVIGRGGAKIKEIGTAARIDLERMLDHKVFLELHVVVKEKWTGNKVALKEMGYGRQE